MLKLAFTFRGWRSEDDSGSTYETGECRRVCGIISDCRIASVPFEVIYTSFLSSCVRWFFSVRIIITTPSWWLSPPWLTSSVIIYIKSQTFLYHCLDLSECGCGTGVAFHIHRNTRMTRWLHRSRILEVLDLCLWQRYTGEVLLTGCQNAWHVLWTKHYDDYMMYTMQIHDIIIYLQYVLLILFVFNSCFIKVMQGYMIPGVCVPMPEGWYLL